MCTHTCTHTHKHIHVHIYTRIHICTHLHTSGGSRISKRRFPLVVDHRRRGLGAQPPAAEEVLILKSIQSIESYNVLYLTETIINYELANSVSS